MLSSRACKNQATRKGPWRSVVRVGLAVILAELFAFALIKAGLGVTWSLAVSCTAGTVALTGAAFWRSAHRRITIAVCRLTDRRTWQFSLRTLFLVTLLLVAVLLAVICDCLLLPRRGPFWTVRVGAIMAAVVVVWVSLIALRAWARRRYQFSIKSLLVTFIPVALLAAVVGWLLDVRNERQYHTSLQIAVHGFNREALHDPVGRNQPPLTQAEVISVIQDSLPRLRAEVRTVYERIAHSGYLPEGARLYPITKFTTNPGGSRRVWWVNLDVSLGGGFGYGMRIRENNNPSASSEKPLR